MAHLRKTPTQGYFPPPPPKKKKWRLPPRRLAALALLFCAVLVAALLLWRMADYAATRQEYARYVLPEAAPPTQVHETALVVTSPPSPAPSPEGTQDPLPPTPAPTKTPVPTAPPFFSTHVQKLAKQNKDTVAYLEIADSAVAYPVVQGKDNDYYLTHSFEKRRRAAGAIFMDSWNSPAFHDFNTVIYGHNMKDGSMFSDLRKYNTAEFLREHKYIEITLLHSKRIYKVFAAYVVDDGFDFRGFGNTSAQQRRAFIKSISYRSEIKTNTNANENDVLLTLVTCTSGNRENHWVVHAVLQEEITTMPAP